MSDLLLDEGFVPGAGPSVVDCRDLDGTNCYCSDEALEELRERLSAVPLDAVHWIDSGDYHYLSALFLERIGEDFELILLDNHPDDQAPAFGGPGALSCGSWVAWSRDRLPFFRQSTGVRGPRSAGMLPVYVSLDLDILSADEFVTDWDQGIMSFGELLGGLRKLFSGRRIIGIDVCGGLTVSKGATDSDLEKNLRLRTLLRDALTGLLLR